MGHRGSTLMRSPQHPRLNTCSLSLPLRLKVRQIRYGLAIKTPCVVLPGGGWCSLTLGPKICRAANITTHT